MSLKREYNRTSTALEDKFQQLQQTNELHLFSRQEFMHLIHEYKDNESWPEALIISDLALSIHLHDADLLAEKIDILLSNKRPDEAMALLPLFERLSTDEVSYTCLRVRALHQMGDADMGRLLLEGVKQWAPTTRLPEIYLLEAGMLQKSGEHAQAYNLYKRILEMDPKNSAALNKIWLASESSKNQKDSLQFHQSLIDRDPYNGLAWFNMGQALYYLLKYEEALEAFEYAGVIEPQFNLTFCFAAEVALAIGQPKRALKNLYDVMQRNPHDPAVLKMTGQSYLALQNNVKARQYFLLARNLDPIDDEIYFNLGNIYMADDKPAIASRYFERAVNLDDRNESYVIALAGALVKEGRFQEAESCFVLATEVAPELPESWLPYAEFKFSAGDYASTLNIIEEALEYTWGAGLYFLRAAVLFNMNKRAEALRAMESALEDDYDTHESFFKYLPGYRQDKDVKAILRYFSLEKAS